MASTNERVAVLETKVDELKETVRANDAELKEQLKTMYEASCSQHAKLSTDIEDLKSFRNSVLARVATAALILGPIAGYLANHIDWSSVLK
jgi:peptidoglycan hydrolase CwlO-like protein